MPVQTKKFSSLMDTDLSEAEIDFLAHLIGLNITFRGNPGQMRVQNIVGNSLVTNSALPAGTNECDGAFYDQVGLRLIWFNWNSNATHAIFIYSTVTTTIQTLLINGAATAGDILGLTLNNPITSINIIYQEAVDGDLLCYVDSLGRPTVINIDFYLSTPYPVTKRSFIDLAKGPPRMPPRVCYEFDSTAAVNNLQNALFKFRERFVFDIKTKSVYGTGSIVPLPYVPFNLTGAQAVGSNSRISIYIETGDIDVTYLEIWGQQTTDNVNSSSWFLIESLNKAQLNIPSNSVYRYTFNNSALYPVGDPVEINQLFDYVPLSANCQELLNGNVLIYGGITEGYNQTPINASLASNQNSYPPVNTINGILFFAAQSGKDSYGNAGDNITVYLTGMGSNDGSNNPITIPAQNLTLVVNCATATGTPLTFSYNTGSNTSVATILAGLIAAAEGQGFNLVSQTTNSFTISQANAVLYYAQSTNTATTIQSQQTSLSYLHKSGYDFALCYFDQKGRTIGAQLPLIGDINTPEDLSGLTVPQIVFTINNRPPTYAYYWTPVRTPTLTYNKYLVWICNQTFVNTDLATGNQYAYIGYSNMDLYNQDITSGNPGGTPVVGYTFQQGDRIRFQTQYPVGSIPFNNTITPNQLSDINDYQIVSVATNPILNGVIQTGNFIKILYPASDIGANFQFGGDNYQNYRIIIYNYAKRNTEGSQELYYEFGEMFAIGNPGTANAFHIGSTQTQTADLSQAAIVTSGEGDFFFRQRTIPTGLTYYINVLAAAWQQAAQVTTTVATEQDIGVIDNSSYQIGEQIQQGANFGPGGYPQYSPTNANHALFWNKLTTPVSIRLRGTDTFSATTNVTFNAELYFKNATQSLQPFSYLFRNFSAVESTTVQSYTEVMDSIISIPPQTQAWFMFSTQASDQSANYTAQTGGFTFQLDVLNFATIPVQDASYLDSYNIVTNSNLRTIAYDQDAKQNYFSTLLRWGLDDQFGTDFNRINRFYFQNQDEIDRSKGDLLRMKARERILRLFQKRGCGEKGVYNTFVTTPQDENILGTTNAIITINNITYYEGEFGVGTHPESLVSGKIQDYFFDPVRGYMVRASQDGLIPVSELYKGQYYIRSLITPYIQNYTKADGSNARIIGCYNYFEEEWIGLLQGGTNGSTTIPSYCLAFNEKRNGYSSFYSFNQAEWLVSIEDNFAAFLNGELWIHNNSNSTAPYCNFFGVQYGTSITTVFNLQEMEKKTFIGLTELASTIWQCPLIYTDQMSYGTQQQQSYLIPANFKTLEGLFQASFMRDTFSAGGWVNGYRLKGSWLAIEFSVPSAPTLVWLSEAAVKFIDSPLNPH